MCMDEWYDLIKNMYEFMKKKRRLNKIIGSLFLFIFTREIIQDYNEEEIDLE